ncbi:MAG: hypothetical protein ACREUV_00255 [Burkholderiales bacterium]
MTGKIFLCISASQATAGIWRRGKLVMAQVFANSEAGWSAFGELLGQNPGLPVHVLVDTVDEDYRFDNLPHSFGGDRREMTARKLRQLYRNNPYSRAWLQGRETDKRRDDRFLFAALTNPEAVAGWLKSIEARQAILAGVYLLPIASHMLLKRFNLQTNSNLLLVSQNCAGLRQTFFRDQKLRISRLTPIEQAQEEMPLAEYAEEISNTRLYLAALKVSPLEEPLLVVILDQSDALADLSKELIKQQSSVLCQYFGRAEISAKLGLAPELLQISPDVMYLHMLGDQQPLINLAPEEKIRPFWRYQARQRIFAAAAGLALIATLWGGINLYQQFQYREDTAQAARRTVQQQALYEEVTKQFPAAPASAENLRTAVEVAQKIRKSIHSPELMFSAVSRALDASPSVLLKSISWKYGGAAETEPGAQRSASATGTKKESGVIEAEIRPFKGDYRAALISINSFVDRLRSERSVAEANVIQLPLNISPGASLSGNTTDSRQQNLSAPFKVVLSLKPAP